MTLMTVKELKTIRADKKYWHWWELPDASYAKAPRLHSASVAMLKICADAPTTQRRSKRVVNTLLCAGALATGPDNLPPVKPSTARQLLYQFQAEGVLEHNYRLTPYGRQVLAAIRAMPRGDFDPEEYAVRSADTMRRQAERVAARAALRPPKAPKQRPSRAKPPKPPSQPAHERQTPPIQALLRDQPGLTASAVYEVYGRPNHIGKSTVLKALSSPAFRSVKVGRCTAYYAVEPEAPAGNLEEE